MRRTRIPAALTLLALFTAPRVAEARPTDTPSDPERHVRAGHAALKAGNRAEARRRYLDAAEGMPDIADWLLRRAALLTADSAGRMAIYSRIVLPVVRERLLETEAVARERSGDLRGAALRYDSLGRVADATRVRLTAASTTEERRTLRQQLVAFIGKGNGSAGVQAAIELVFTARLDLSADEALVVARAASRNRLPSRTIALFPRAISAGLATAEDRLAHGMALAQLGRYREALVAYSRVPPTSTAAPEAAYQRALALSRLGLDDSARAVLKRLTATPDGASPVIPKGLYLAGDLRWRARDTAGARALWLDLVHRYPRHELAGRAGFLAALTLWEGGRLRDAAAEWERIHLIDGGPEGQAAGYWAGRAFDRLGDARRAQLQWHSVMARDSLSYYAVVSAQRLGVAPWLPPAAPDRFSMFPDLDSTATRLALLRALDMTDELGWERDRLLAESTNSVERLLASADLLRRDGQPSAAVALGRRALRAGAAADARTYRLIFPILHETDLRQQATSNGLDPILVAALIRQESMWEPKARSRAGAMGLMQVMPTTGRQVAHGLGVTRWHTDQLMDPATNLRIGTRYLAEGLRRFEGNLGRALAAYNAGASRIGPWASGMAATDPDLFVERISISETRDYVRIIQRNLVLYRALYGS